MIGRHNERGEGRIGFLITLAVFGVGIFLAIKLVPVKVDAYQFNEALKEEARFASANHNDELVVERIFDTAASMNIPLDKKSLRIKRTRTEVIISASYEKPVDLKFTTYTYKFASEQKAPLF